VCDPSGGPAPPPDAQTQPDGPFRAIIVPMTPADRIAAIAARFGIDALYAFGSRATEALARVEGGSAFEAGGPSDLDVAVLPLPGRVLNTDERVALAAALEDLFPAPRVDLVVLPEAPPFVALAAVSGELLYVGNRVRESHYQLFVMRRAGDLAPYERARRAHVLSAGL